MNSPGSCTQRLSVMPLFDRILGDARNDLCRRNWLHLARSVGNRPASVRGVSAGHADRERVREKGRDGEEESRDAPAMTRSKRSDCSCGTEYQNLGAPKWM